jgi:hypothetical protein
VLKQYNKELDEEAKPETIQLVHKLSRVENLIYYTCIFLTFFGVIVHYGKNKSVYGRTFDIKQFITRSAKCNNNFTTLKMNNNYGIFKNFKNAFN